MLTFIQEKKKTLRLRIKNVLVKHAMKGSLSVQGYYGDKIVLTLRSGVLDIEHDFRSNPVNKWYGLRHIKLTLGSKKEHTLCQFKNQKIIDFIGDCYDVLMKDNWDHSDQLDNYSCGWHAEIHVGKESVKEPKPYQLLQK